MALQTTATPILAFSHRGLATAGIADPAVKEDGTHIYPSCKREFQADRPRADARFVHH
jgi:hypothetical protein